MCPAVRPPSTLDLKLTKLTPAAFFLRAAVEKRFPRRSGMSGRERVIRAIEFRGPDKIPHQKRDFWFLFHVPPTAWQPPPGYYPYVHPGILQTRSWRWKERSDLKWLQETRTAIDEFGTVWKVPGHTTLGETVRCPLEEGYHLLNTYHLPDMKDWRRFARSALWGRRLKGERYCLGVDSSSIWERFRFLRGFENAMMDLVLQPEQVRRLLGLLTNMTLDTVDNFKKAGADGFMLVDDWGTQKRSFISPRHFEEFFLPCYRRITARCHERGMHCGLHSCGDLRDLMPLLLQCGLDFLQLDSPDMCGLDWLAENAAGRICLWCSVDIQNVYPTNDPVRIEQYIKEMILKLGEHEGGLVGWPYSEPWVIGVGRRAERCERRAFERWGRYPLDHVGLTSR